MSAIKRLFVMFAPIHYHTESLRTVRRETNILSLMAMICQEILGGI